MARGGLRRGFKKGKSCGGVKALTWHLCAKAGWPTVAEEDGSVTGIWRHKVGDEADGWGPHGGDRREKRCYGRNAQS
jgi:hypothetical protein